MKTRTVTFLPIILAVVLLVISIELADFYSLEAPANNTFTNNQTVDLTLNVSFTGEFNASLTNITLWITQAGIMLPNRTNV